ncbi:MAG: type I-C CRISPR-associated protein Cas8c/Csd1, partial [Desulfamplus sp.]|nr:type I-C CRISPR-associated protein Cas8c/Csd1 [Desulfamplus sp.]
MILQALHEYYLRRAADSDSGIAPEGMERKEIPFIIVIDNQGNFIDFQDTRDSTEDKGKKAKKVKSFLVPKSVGRPGKKGWQTAFLLWDHFGYVLAHPKSESDKDREMAQNQNTTFVNKIKELP